MLKKRLAAVGAVSALVVGGAALVTPAHATHACDPSVEVLCTHPEREVDDMLNLLCDKFVIVDKIVELVGDCGSS